MVDTSVWVDHFKRRNEALVILMLRDEALTHPTVLGEPGPGVGIHQARKALRPRLRHCRYVIGGIHLDDAGNPPLDAGC